MRHQHLFLPISVLHGLPDVTCDHTAKDGGNDNRVGWLDKITVAAEKKKPYIEACPGLGI